MSVNGTSLVTSNYEQAVNVLRKVSGQVEFVINPYVDPAAEQSDEEEEEAEEEEEEEEGTPAPPTIAPPEVEPKVEAVLPSLEVSEPVHGEMTRFVNVIVL